MRNLFVDFKMEENLMGLLKGQEFGIDEVFVLGKLKGCVILTVIDQWCEDTMSAWSMH